MLIENKSMMRPHMEPRATRPLDVNGYCVKSGRLEENKTVVIWKFM